MLHGWSTSSFYSVNSPYWTMAVESHFYLLLPLLSWIIIKLSRSASFRKPGFALLGAFLLVGHPILNTLFLRVPALSEHRTILEVFQHLSAFAVGMACSTLYIAVSEGKGIGISKERTRRELSRLAGISGSPASSCITPPSGFLRCACSASSRCSGPSAPHATGASCWARCSASLRWQRDHVGPLAPLHRRHLVQHVHLERADLRQDHLAHCRACLGASVLCSRGNLNRGRAGALSYLSTSSSSARFCVPAARSASGAAIVARDGTGRQKTVALSSCDSPLRRPNWAYPGDRAPR